MICGSCGLEIDDGRRFCNRCGADQAPSPPAPFVNAGATDDVLTVDFARIPSEMRAPTTWTIAKGVFLGLLLWSVAAAIVSAVVFVLFVASVGSSASNELEKLSPTGGSNTKLSDQDCKELFLPDDQQGYEDCVANN